MKIVADENIPLLKSVFESIGEITTYPGREISNEHLADADVLLVRSVTSVNKALLKGTPVRFVGSATIGLDHVDIDYLQKQKIVYANAPACNANSVVEYVLSCLSFMSEYYQFDLSDKSVGVVGCGNVGGLLTKRLKKLGVTVKRNDPPLSLSLGADQGKKIEFVSLDEALACDIITFHVPLVKNGEFPTHHLLDKKRISKLRADQIVINTSRGSVVDNDALLKKLDSNPGMPIVLDVWENEPNINTDLLKKVAIGTPHIAGYSFDGKAVGTEMIYLALCKYLGLPARQKVAQYLSEPPLTKLAFSGQADADWVINTAIRACYDVRSDHWRLRKAASNEVDIAKVFDKLRRQYPVRREFHNTKILLKNVDSEIHNRLKTLGFKMKP